jgi:DNA-binding MarR family transcriptional regulator
MEKLELTEKEKLTLYGLTHYPKLTDKELSEKLDLKHSTVTSIRHRLREGEYFRTLTIPKLQNLGCKMLVVIYTNFSPLIPLEERVEITGRTIEVFDEIFFSVGEQDKGFSLSLSKDYASIGRINDIRTRTFGGRGLLEDEYPNMIVFPFEISKIYRFFDFSPLLKNRFKLFFQNDEIIEEMNSDYKEEVIFSDTEKEIYCMLVKYPELSDKAIGSDVGLSRHSISRLRRKFEQKDLLKKINLPDLKKLGFEILSFYHITFDPRNPPEMEKNDAVLLMDDSTVFLASRQFEAVMLSVYIDYDDYNRDKTRIVQVLKENKWIAEEPIIRTYSLNELIYIKDFKFTPIARKILGYDMKFL